MKSIDWQRLLKQPLWLATLGILFPFYINSFILLFLVGWIVYQERHHLWDFLKETRSILILSIYSMIISSIYNNLFGVLVGIVFYLFGIFFVYYRRHLTAQILVDNLMTLMIGSIGLGLMAIVNYLHYALTHGYGVWYIFKYHNIQTRAEATFFNANYYGLFCLFAFVIGLYLFERSDKQWIKRTAVVSIIINVIGVVLTGSRMLLPMVVLLAIWFYLWVKPKYLIPLIIFGIVGIVALIIKPDLIPRMASLDYAFEDRMRLWKVGWGLFKTSPWTGRGVMAYMNDYYLFANTGDMHSHSLYIEALANFGIIGVLYLGGIALYNLKPIIKLFKKPKFRIEFALITSFILAVMVHGLVDVAIFWVQTGYVFLIVTLVPFNIWLQVPQTIKQYTLLQED